MPFPFTRIVIITMDYNIQSFTVLFPAVVALLAVVCYAAQRRRLCPPLPPGPTGLPLLGSLLSLSPELHVYFTKLGETYGPIYKIWLGSKLCVVVSSPALAREVLLDNDRAMANHDVPATAKVFAYGGSNVLFSPLGPTWRMLRRVCVQEALSPASVGAVCGLRQREVRATVGHVRARAGEVVDVRDQLFATVSNVVTSIVWGATAEEDGEERSRVGREFKELVAEAEVLLGLPNVSDCFPALARLDLQGLQARMGLVKERFDRIFSSMIEKKKNKVAKDQEEGGRGKDFLDCLLKLEEEDGGDDTKTPFTMANVKGILMVIKLKSPF